MFQLERSRTLFQPEHNAGRPGAGSQPDSACPATGL
jgi:hypothetical protein